jgi:hypothetical protein
MTLPRLESFSEAAGPALASLTDTIGQLIKPTAKYDQALKAIFLEKPELMQKFVDVEKKNPGTLKAFGFSEGATDFLSGMKESVPSIRSGLGAELLEGAGKASEQARRTAGEQEATGLTPAQAVGDKLKEFLLTEGQTLLDKDPRAYDAAVRNILGVPSKFEQQKEADVETAYQGGLKLSEMAIPDIVKGIQSGAIKASDLSGGSLHPAATVGTKLAIEQYSQEREGEIKQRLLQVPRQFSSYTLEAARERGARDVWKSSGGAAPLAAFYEHMYGQPYGGTPSTPEDLNKVKEYLKTSQSEKEVKRKTDLYKAIEPLYLSTIRKPKKTPPSEEQVRKNIRQMNELLTASGSEWRAEYDVNDHWWPKADEPKVVFRNNTGDISTDLTPILSEVPPPGGYPNAKDNPPELDAYQQQIWAQLQSLPPHQMDSVLSDLYEAAGDDEKAKERIAQIIDNLPAQ